MKKVAVISLIASLTCSSIFAKSETNGAYCNGRYAFLFNIPADVFISGSESHNGDGLRLVAKDNASLSVYGGHNTNNDTISSAFNSEVQSSRNEITFKVSKDNWYVISGYEQSNIFYKKTYLVKSQFKTFYFSYPKSAQGLYGPIIEKISKNFDPDVHVTVNQGNGIRSYTCHPRK